MTGYEYESEDVWINAFAALPNLHPLVQLLLSDIPVTAGARRTLAELLSPGDPPIDSFILEVKPNKEFDKTLRKFVVEAEYAIRTGEGKSSDIAAEEAGTLASVGPRQAHRYLGEGIVQRLRQRLKEG